MKHLLTAIACFFALSMSAQTPYNPDSDSDNVIGSVDLLDLLPLYGGPFFPSTDVTIDTLSWEGIDSDTLMFPVDAQVVVFDCGDLEPFYDSPTPVSRNYTIPYVEGFHQWLVLMTPPSNYVSKYTNIDAIPWCHESYWCQYQYSPVSHNFAYNTRPAFVRIYAIGDHVYFD